MALSHYALIGAIAAAECTGDRQSPAPRFADHEPVARRKPFVAERQPPQSVVAMRIDPRLIEHQIGLEALRHLRQMAFERGEVARIVGPVGERDIAIRACFADRKILLGVKPTG